MSTVVDFTHSNAAPAAVTPPAYAGTGAVPGALALPATVGAPSNTPPAGVTPPSFAGTADNPAALAVAGLTPSNALPAGIAPPSFVGTASAPEALELAPTTPEDTDPEAIPLADQAATEDAPEAVELQDLGGTAETPAARSLPTPTAGTPNVPQIVGYAATLPAPTDATMHTPAFTFAGRLTAAQLFGFYKPAVAVAVKGVQLAIQDAAVGADVIIELVDADGVGLGRSATLPAGSTYADVVFVTPLPLAANTLLRAKVTQVGSAKAGSFLTANLIVQIA